MVREEIIELLKSTKRDGIEGLVIYLIQEGFFESPASMRYHGCYAGGLAAHSLGVHKLLAELNTRLALGIAEETLIIAPLLHDVCKIGAYLGSGKTWRWNRAQPRGHGRLSIERISKYIKLTELEELMIKYHMGVYRLYEFDSRGGEYPLRGDSAKSKEERRGRSLANAWHHNPIVKIMYFCDEIVTLEEKEGGE